ncbi:MAG: hypothetical protein KGL53_16175 [Elusimicrobia bacterium]|nr:hypothetical protein [Elusimicrobiota bacterium]
MRAWALAVFLVLPALTAARAASSGSSDDPADAVLWQERYGWDGLLQARDRAARVSADPRLLAVVKAIAYQAAQQTANLAQIQTYAKAQSDNLRYAFAQEDPGPSLKIIQGNFRTLAKGAEQVRNNLYYLTVRLRICQTQALSDPKLTQMAMLDIAQIQQIQLRLNDLYLSAAAANQLVGQQTWGVTDFFRFASEHLLNTVIDMQDAVFSVYNAAFELYQLSQPDPGAPPAAGASPAGP